MKIHQLASTILYLLYRAQTVTDKIFTLIREVAGENRVVKLGEIIERCTSKGYKPDQVSYLVLIYKSHSHELDQIVKLCDRY